MQTNIPNEVVAVIVAVVAFMLGVLIGAGRKRKAAPAPAQPAEPAIPALAKPLRRGARGGAVRVVQIQLAIFGADIRVDGKFGAETAAAVKAFQRRQNLKPIDGVVGPETWTALHSL